MVEKLVKSDRKPNSPNKVQSEGASMLTDQAIELNFVRNKLENFQTSILRDVEKRLNGMIDEVMCELRQHELQTSEFRSFAKTNLTTERTNSTWNNRGSRGEINTHDLNHSGEDKKLVTKKLNASLRKNTKETLECCENQITNLTKQSVDEHDGAFVASKVSNKLLSRFPEKIFINRESYLTALLEVNHMKSIYHIFYIIFLVFLINNIAYNYLEKGSLNIGLATFKGGFAGVHKAFAVWLIQKSFTISIYYALDFWFNVRSKLSKHSNLQRAWSVSCLLLYILAQVLFAYIPTIYCLSWNLPFATASAFLLETTRMLMKMHGYVRTVAARIIGQQSQQKDDEDDDGQCKQIRRLPELKCYFYYLFAPTLLYRDSYPRTTTIRWRYAAARFLEVVAVAFLYSYIYERHIFENFNSFGKEELNAGSMVIKLFGMLMPSMIIFLCGFYMILHSWCNFTAELLRFGDRMFYKDWWTANNYESYYRNWNVVVHDWLYEYIYKDFYTYIFKGSKIASSLTVFFISALFHEYVLGYALQVVFPVMFVFFAGVGVIMIFVTRLVPKNFGNICIWFSLIYGNCAMISLYSMEYFAKQNCPKDGNVTSWSEYLMPHVWHCFK